MDFIESIAAASIPALAAVLTLWLNNRHNLRMLREDREAERKTVAEDRQASRDEARQSAAAASAAAETERKQRRIAEALNELGSIQGELTTAQVERAGGYIPREPVSAKAVGALATSLHLVLLEYPHGWLMQDMNETLQSVRRCAAHLSNRSDSNPFRNFDSTLEQIQELGQGLVELSANAAVDWNATPSTPSTAT